MFEIIKKWKSPQSSATNVIFTFCVISVINHPIAIINALIYNLTGPVIIARICHGTLAFIILTLMVFQKKTWSHKTCIIIFLLLVLPLYYIGWETELALSRFPQWSPFTTFKFYAVLLAFLVPGPYLLNFFFLSLLCLQAIFHWFYLDIAHAPNAVLTAEPFLSFIFAITAFCILAFRYRDQKIIEDLGKQKARIEVYEKVARIFLSMRDKVNTPLQSQNLVVALLKKNSAVKPETIEILERSVVNLERINNILKRLESNLPVTSFELMTEDEIYDYLDQLERQSKK